MLLRSAANISIYILSQERYTQRMALHVVLPKFHWRHCLATAAAVAAAAILSCCDVVPAGPAATNWTKALDGKGKPCEDEHHGAAKDKAKEKNTTMVDDHSGHNHTDGHDHSGHNHSTTATAPAGGSKPKSAAESATLGMVTALAAAVAIAALFVL